MRGGVQGASERAGGLACARCQREQACAWRAAALILRNAADCPMNAADPALLASCVCADATRPIWLCIERAVEANFLRFALILASCALL